MEPSGHFCGFRGVRIGLDFQTSLEYCLNILNSYLIIMINTIAFKGVNKVPICVVKIMIRLNV